MQKVVGLAILNLALIVVLVAPGVAQAPPSIRIVSPQNGERTLPGRITVRVTVENLALNASAIGTAAKAGEGHWHVYVDGVLAGMAAGDSIDLPNRTVTRLTAGWHTINVQLRNNDHTPLRGMQSSWISVVRVPQTVTFP